MTGALDIPTQAKKFWPKLTHAVGEGLDASRYGGGNDGAVVAPVGGIEPPLETIVISATVIGMTVQLSWTGSTGRCVVDFGDFTQHTTALGVTEHTYAVAGTYTVRIADEAREFGTVDVTVPGALVAVRGPFEANGIPFWIDTVAWAAAFDVDADPEPDVFVDLRQLSGLPRGALTIIRNKARELGWTG